MKTAYAQEMANDFSKSRLFQIQHELYKRKEWLSEEKKRLIDRGLFDEASDMDCDIALFRLAANKLYAFTINM